MNQQQLADEETRIAEALYPTSFQIYVHQCQKVREQFRTSIPIRKWLKKIPKEHQDELLAQKAKEVALLKTLSHGMAHILMQLGLTVPAPDTQSTDDDLIETLLSDEKS